MVGWVLLGFCCIGKGFVLSGLLLIELRLNLSADIRWNLLHFFSLLLLYPLNKPFYSLNFSTFNFFIEDSR